MIVTCCITRSYLGCLKRATFVNPATIVRTIQGVHLLGDIVYWWKLWMEQLECLVFQTREGIWHWQVQLCISHKIEGCVELVTKHITEGEYCRYLVGGETSEYYLVQWAGAPCVVVEGMVVSVDWQDMHLLTGKWMCDGYWLDNIPHTKHWYWVGHQNIIFWLQHVLRADLNSDNNHLTYLPPSVLTVVLTTITWWML